MKTQKYINLEELKELIKNRNEINDKIKTFNKYHCRECGVINPKNGFVPMLSYAYGEDMVDMSSSPYICNDCNEKFKKSSN